MKNAMLGLLLLVPCTLYPQSETPKKQAATPSRSKLEAPKLDPGVVAQQNRIQRLIGPNTKQTLALMVPAFEERAMQLPPSTDFYKLASSEVHSRFPNSTKQSTDVLVFAMLSQAVQNLGAKIDGMNEVSEMTSLRLQMLLDRRSKFISTLSNIMKSISETKDTVVGNLK